MKTNIYSLVFSIVICLAGVFVQAEGLTEKVPAKITIGFIPGGDKVTAQKGAQMLADNLQKRINIPVEIYVSETYSGLAEAFKSKKVEFGFFTALTYVLAEKEAGAKVLLKKVWIEPFYYSILVTSKKSKIKNLQDLKGKTVAFVDEKSTSGYLYPMVALKKKKMGKDSLKSISFSGSHSKSVEMLDAGEVDVIAVFSDDVKGLHSALQKYSKNQNQYKVIWASEPIPNDPFTVRQDFYDVYPKLSHSLMLGMIDAADELQSKDDFRNFFGANSFMLATASQYESVREVSSALSSEIGIK